MDIPGSFQTIAEISIAFAGFTGLIVAFRRNDGPLDNVQKYRLRILLTLAFGAMFLSLLPDALVNFGVRGGYVWILCCTAMSLYSVIFLTWWIAASRRIAKLVPEIFDWKVFSAIAAAHVIVLLFQLSAVFGVVEDRSAGILNLGLIWYLLHAAQQFVRMLFVQPKTR
jgi:hypothetical protein